MSFVQYLFNKCRVYLILSCNMMCGSLINIFVLPSIYDNQSCAKRYLLRIPFRWVCSWLQLVFLPKTVCSIL